MDGDEYTQGPLPYDQEEDAGDVIDIYRKQLSNEKKHPKVEEPLESMEAESCQYLNDKPVVKNKNEDDFAYM